MSHPADRNLLFGILALQMDFISREQLIAAMNAWVLEKDTPLGQILLKHGALTSDTHALLEALVAKHLEMHGGDPEKSLAAVSSVKSLRNELQQLNDPDVQASLANVSIARQDADPFGTRPDADPFGTRPAVVGDTSSNGQRFRILRPHARGGLGKVSVARDSELNREVALKEILEDKADSENNRQRFLLEAEITGGLEHPGIVPVYGLGQYADGRPFYAMRFIRGDSLKDAIERFHARRSHHAPRDESGGGVDPPSRNLHAEREGYVAGFLSIEFRKLLGRFIDVCEAMQYAHSRGVLHRDLKPGNIMLGKYGETLVVDWGLAKAQDQSETPAVSKEPQLRPASGSGTNATQMGSAVGTPAFMSPEQAAGRLDLLSPASDVYCLGATLYCLLTGRAPVMDRDVPEILKKVEQGNFPRPREIRTQIPAALEAICLRAMALNPPDRYPSARDLADDIERWLADEPVSAFPEPLIVRGRRWMRRHPALVSSTAAAVLVATLTLSVLFAVVAGKNEQLANLNSNLDTTNSQLKQTNNDLTTANERESTARKLAETNATAAREQSQLALGTLKSVIFDVQRSIMILPGGATVRRQILLTVLPQLEKVSTEFESRAMVDRYASVALLELGDTFLQLGQISPVDTRLRRQLSTAEPMFDSAPAALSAIDAAERLYKRANAISQQLVTHDPNNTLAQRDLSLSLEKLGDLAMIDGNLAEARQLFEESFRIVKHVGESDPTNSISLRDLYISIAKRGKLAMWQGDISEAQRLLGESQGIAQRLAESDPTNTEWQRDLHVLLIRRGELANRQENLSEAQRFFEQSLRIAQRLAKFDPANELWQLDLATSFQALGDLATDQGNQSDALQLLGESLGIRHRLAESDPNNSAWQRDLSMTLDSVGNLALKQRNLSEAARRFDESLRICQRLAESDPGNAAWQR